MEPNNLSKLCDLEDPVSPILSSDLSFIYGQGYKTRSHAGNCDRTLPESAVKTTRNQFPEQIADSNSQHRRQLDNPPKINSDQQDKIGSTSRPPTMPSGASFVTPSTTRFGFTNRSSIMGSGSHHVATPYASELRAMRVRITEDRPTVTDDTPWLAKGATGTKTSNLVRIDASPAVGSAISSRVTDDVDAPTSTPFDINSLRVKINLDTDSSSMAVYDEDYDGDRTTVDCCDSTPAIVQSSYAPPPGSGRNVTSAQSSHAASGFRKPEPSWPKMKLAPPGSTTYAPHSPEFDLQNAETAVNTAHTLSPEDRDYVTAATCTPPAYATTRPPPTVSANPPSDRIIRVNGEPYHVMKLIGQGGSCKVYEVYDMNRQLRAIKCVQLTSKEEDICYINEIALLRKLQGSNRVIKLYGSELNEEDRSLYVVMERGDVDLATLIRSASDRGQITDAMIKFYWSEMLLAVQVIHHEGIIHSDLKPSNFLIVEGQLKLIDFGISSAIPDDLTSIIKENAMGTPSYMSPEALKDEPVDAQGAGARRIKIGVKSDVWSLGCILYHIVHGRTPFSHIRRPYKLFCAIADPKHDILFPPVTDPLLDDVLKRCIVRDPKQRASIDYLLKHPYLTGATSAEMKPMNKTVESLMHQISELSPNSMKKISQVVSLMNISKPNLDQ